MRRWMLVGLVVVLVAGAVVVTAVVTRADQEDIFLEGANTVGMDPFTTVAAVTPEQTTTVVTALDQTTTTALYGGTGDQQYCDPEALITFLQSNPDKARAWVAALNADPGLRWSGGRQLTVDDIPTYIRELTPAILAADTRVTNHGFKNGKATPRQSVLEKGTAVLVDADGIPRTRCACGNPLLPPEKVDHPHYKGPCWLDEPTTTTRRPTTTTTLVDQSTTTTLGDQTTTSVTPGAAPIALGPSLLKLALARPTNRCGDEEYCSPPGCTATSVATTTTLVEETTTTACVTSTGAPCRPPTTRPPVTTTRRPPTTQAATTTTVTRPATTTTVAPPPPSSSTTVLPQ